MPDTLLKDEPDLSETEFATAIMGAVSDGENTGRTRKLAAVLLAQMLHSENPLVIRTEDVTLYDTGDNTTLTESDSINLDIKEGTTRHSFADGFFGLSFLYINSSNNRLYEQFVTINAFLESSDSKQLPLRGTGSITFWRVSDTVFGAANYLSTTSVSVFINKIVGHKLTLSLDTPL